jgi:hypothetical protein
MDDNKGEMNKTYVIQWKSRVNGRMGRGTKLFELEEAARLAQELNREYPQIEHEVLNTLTEGTPDVRASMSAASTGRESNPASPVEALAA